MDPKARLVFLALVVTQAFHSLEEYYFALYEVFGPARMISALVSSNAAAGFAIVNASFVVFGVWCYFARVRGDHANARMWVWPWIVIELGNGVGHPAIALGGGGYFPGVATAPILLVLAGYLAYQRVLPSSSRRSAV